jgi:ferredoxin/flavodoxin---NADP+ reductase
MFKITEKVFLSENVAKLVIEAPYIAKSRKAGHFIILRIDENGERVPLTIADADLEKGTITLIVQRVGVSTHKLCAMNPGDKLAGVVGPLGTATHIAKVGTVLCAGGGVGVAPLFPIVQALKLAGNKVITVIAARNKDLIILEDKMREYSDELIIMTDDGSKGTKGLITQGMEEVILREKINEAMVIGPTIMMKYAALTTKKYGIPTQASLNTIMVDGTGMCGACRVTVGGKTEFVCVDGPEFNAHEVNFDEMLNRLNTYKTKETKCYREYLAESGIDSE